MKKNVCPALYFLVMSLAPCARAEAPRVPAIWTPPALSSAQYESSPTFTPDGREMYFFRADQRFSNYRLQVSRCIDGAWSASTAPPFALPGALEADPFVTPDGRWLYFISTRHHSSQTGEEDLDIFRVARHADGAWGAVERLPAPVNSPASELLPRLDDQGRLWFGSSREGGHGQGDIYIATFDGKNWTVRNAGPPISTPAYEYEAEVSRDGKTVVVVANRGQRSHLYLFHRDGDSWLEAGQIPARDDVFQVGPLLSPSADRLLFAQASGDLSGELFILDLTHQPRPWPPECR